MHSFGRFGILHSNPVVCIIQVIRFTFGKSSKYPLEAVNNKIDILIKNWDELKTDTLIALCIFLTVFFVRKLG